MISHITYGTEWLRADLPDRVCVFAGLCCAPEHWLAALLPQVIHTHCAIVQAHGQQVRVLWVDVQTHHSTGCREYEPGGRGGRGREGETNRNEGLVGHHLTRRHAQRCSCIHVRMYMCM